MGGQVRACLRRRFLFVRFLFDIFYSVSFRGGELASAYANDGCIVNCTMCALLHNACDKDLVYLADLALLALQNGFRLAANFFNAHGTSTVGIP